MAKLKFATKEEWLDSNMGLRMIQEAQQMLEKAQSTLEWDIELGVTEDITYTYPRLGSKLDITGNTAMEVCYAFSSWAVTALERDWKCNGNLFDIVWKSQSLF